MIRATLTAIVMLWAFGQTVPQQPRESASCQSNIVSSTVVATFCGHRQGDNEMLDLLILWRGRQGGFQRHPTRRRGGGREGSRALMPAGGAAALACSAPARTEPSRSTRPTAM